MYSIRYAAADDCAAIHDIAAQAFPDTYKDILTPEQRAYMMEWMYSLPNLRKQMEEGCVYLLLDDADGVPVGYASVQREGEDLFTLHKIYLLPSVQGKGAGGFLFRAVLNHVKEVHPAPCAIRLNVNRYNRRAQAFYKHMGMTQVDEGDFPIGGGYYMNDYILSLDL